MSKKRGQAFDECGEEERKDERWAVVQAVSYERPVVK